ncbi:conserved hypothetical protein [Candidatus Desulfosporosinus infrequens]|uniref:Uncharacterized protein n=1 Tax=Candidatus Desulfosporosinus infrequens TaxID=2043169 RepID=A0A2U3KF64_9FIRM|nr:conserved hypothetical protein [Candidatus Desulfosporosinus infrequens]
MKEKNVWLSPEELQHLLQGSLQWIDVASRMTSSRTGIRMANEAIPEKHSVARQVEKIRSVQSEEKEQSSKRLEGQPVIWLLGSVGLLTLSSWFYFVVFSR